MKCIIVDDEKMSQMMVQKCVEQVPYLDLVTVCDNAIEASEIIRKSDIDLIFLDIEMPEMTGIEFVNNFSVPQIIFITSKPEFATEAFDLDVTDYIVKPVDLVRFLKAVSKAKDRFDKEMSRTIEAAHVFVKQDSRYVKLSMIDIQYVEALADYVSIFTAEKRYTILSTMKAIESKLPPSQFVRVHRSFIVRIDQIKEIEDNTIAISEKLIPVSRSYRDHLKKSLNML
ncbi:MAG: DNA-binding LytR/AlgR family response regulator [Sphingobacteriales bacterium]|jgi:DNA-binding LytR/AlgR family response regulator